MKRIAQKAWLSASLFILYFPIASFAQDVTGIWRGYFITHDGEHYKLEFQVKQNQTPSVTGVSYSYLDVRFYGKATMTGSYLKNSGNFRIKEIRTVEVQSTTGGGTCIMNYDLAYSRSGKEEFLEGTYLGKTEVKGGANPYEWGQCGYGKVFLRKVPTSDFYIEPFLRKNNPVSRLKVDTAVKRNPPPVTKNKPVTKTPVTTKPKQPAKDISKTNPPPATRPGTDTIVKKINTPDLTVRDKPVITPLVLKERTNELMKSLTVNNPDVTVRLYDNGEIDDDTISIYYDKKLLVSRKRLSATAITLKLKIEDVNVPHELVMVAENLGRIPPNTSLMIVDAGDQRFDVRITSNEQKNALVRFKYERPQSQ